MAPISEDSNSQSVNVEKGKKKDPNTREEQGRSRRNGDFSLKGDIANWKTWQAPVPKDANLGTLQASHQKMMEAWKSLLLTMPVASYSRITY